MVNEQGSLPCFSFSGHLTWRSQNPQSRSMPNVLEYKKMKVVANLQ
jgi:hypothetical protein|uniref:Uncharacterized protein n=1 Tax=Faecalibaculum rodentium TaxID=1702221 RepID=A0A140DYI5_9FIRM|nr:hypothetical protein AALO17_25780 [Faecalibaculum rodentium]